MCECAGYAGAGAEEEEEEEEEEGEEEENPKCLKIYGLNKLTQKTVTTSFQFKNLLLYHFSCASSRDCPVITKPGGGVFLCSTF
jgi:hypothetical protein